MQPFILHGPRDFPRDLPLVTLRPNGLDTAAQNYLASDPHTFAKGGRFPGLPNFYITESEARHEPTGLAHEVRLRGEGLHDGRDREEENEINVTDEGWDSGPITILTLNPDTYTRGNAHPHIPTLWILETRKKRIAGPPNSTTGIWRVSADCKGIIPQAGDLPKGRKRRITVGNQVVTSSTDLALTNSGTDADGDPFPFWNKETDTWTGWSPGRSTALDSSRVQVADTFLTWDAPPTDTLPGHLTPENAPDVKDIFATAWFSSSGFTWNWPWGWSLKSISSEPLLYGLPGTPYLTTIVTEYVPRAVPK